ncbi:chaperone NapD [Simiduia agarivorans]|uniref:Chaperone NapD n=1 Tax=Simiduia agarivorans (strain DSM 21679 / JCM 13881 / BCRC 17597 / SA1) TaxID=1117647 RepID=K4KH51_SIMAS|nr:chaperone NapD [Simiduia agarivorans]AFU98331.1 hypothetical protein M5M_05630 [Simiduia agarivorans SA1 = DSM 21679]
MIATDATLHIASLIVQCLPAAQAPLKLLIESHPGAEVGAEASGKLVVVIEATHTQQIMDFIDRVQLEAGVLSATLVYHCDDAEGDVSPIDPSTQEVCYEAP